MQPFRGDRSAQGDKGRNEGAAGQGVRRRVKVWTQKAPRASVVPGTALDAPEWPRNSPGMAPEWPGNSPKSGACDRSFPSLFLSSLAKGSLFLSCIFAQPKLCTYFSNIRLALLNFDHVLKLKRRREEKENAREKTTDSETDVRGTRGTRERMINIITNMERSRERREKRKERRAK